MDIRLDATKYSEVDAAVESVNPSYRNCKLFIFNTIYFLVCSRMSQ